MAFNFIEIEKEKNRLIAVVFIIVVLFYFTGVWLLIFLMKSIFMSLLQGRAAFSLPPARLTFQVLGASFSVGIIHWFVSINRLIDKMSEAVNARPIDEQDEYHLYFRNIVNEVSVAVGGRPLQPRVIPDLDLNAFAIADFDGRAVIGVTEGVLCRLNRTQIEAVVAHEAAHIISGDCLSTTVTSSLGELYEDLVERISNDIADSDADNGPNLIGPFVWLFLGFVNGLGTLLRMFVSRQREFRADALAVRMTRDPLSLAEALHLIGRHWRGAGLRVDRLSSIFIVNPRFDPLDEESGFIADLFSTHPPIRTRIGVLADMAHVSDDELVRKLKDFRRVSPIQSQDAGTSRDFFLTDIGSDRQDIDPYSFGLFPCPHCGRGLSDRTYEGVVLKVCSECGGVLVHQDRLTRTLFRQDTVYSPQLTYLCQTIMRDFKKHQILKKIHPANAWVITCPECGNKMHREFYAMSYAVEIDRCLNCKKVWFDKNELEILQYLFEHNKELFDGVDYYEKE
jgi:heat shock protein HtpX